MLNTFIKINWSADGIVITVIIVLGIIIFFATLGKILNHYHALKEARKRKLKKTEIIN
jgi:hypothetical protein